MPSLTTSALRVLLAIAMLATATATSHAQEFYKGKNISIMVSGAGVYEAYARMLASTMPKYIPGRPSMIVQQMPGNGGIRAANFINSIAPKDGTVIAGTHGGILTAALLSPDVTEFDVNKLAWIGNVTRDTYLGYVFHTAPIQKFEDAKSTTMIVGGTSVGGAGIDVGIFARDMLGYKIKIVSGYKSSQESKIAMERGEIHGTMGNAVSSLLATDWLQTGKVRVLFQHGTKPHRLFPNVPLFRSFVHDEEQRGVLDLIGVREEVSKPYFAPPGIPADRLAMLRQAFDASLKDADFLAEAKRQQIEPEDSMSGDQLADVARRVAATPPAVANKLVDLFRGFKDGK